MDASSVDRGRLIARADAAVREAQRLRCELDRQRAVADAILRRSQQFELFETGLYPAELILLCRDGSA